MEATQKHKALDSIRHDPHMPWGDVNEQDYQLSLPNFLIDI